MSDEERLQRIEDKVDKLQEAVVTLARIEERTTTLFNYYSKLVERVSTVEYRQTEHDKKINNRFSERIFWLVVAAAIAGLFSLRWLM